MTNSEMIAQLEAELKSLKAALAACTPKTDPALVASLKKSDRNVGTDHRRSQVGAKTVGLPATATIAGMLSFANSPWH